MAAQTPANGRVHPAVKFPGRTSTEYLAWLGGIERDARRGSSALDEHAVTVHRGIIKAKSLPFALNRHIAARKQRRLVLRMARAAEALAQAARAAQLQWKADFGQTSDARQVRTNGFDMAK